MLVRPATTLEVGLLAVNVRTYFHQNPMAQLNVALHAVPPIMSILRSFTSGKNKQMNEQYHTVNTCQWKRHHLAIFSTHIRSR